MHPCRLGSLDTWLCIFKDQYARLATFEMVNFVKVVAHLSQAVGPFLTELVLCSLIIGVVAEQTFPCSQEKDVRMRLSACQSRIISTDDTIGERSKELWVACGLDIVVPALAACSDADGDVVLVQMLNETGGSFHLWYLLECLEEDLVAVFEEGVYVKGAVRCVKLAWLGWRP